MITDSGNKLREAIGAQIQRDLDQIGIQVDFQPIAFSALINTIFNNLDWECHIIGLAGGIEPHDNANIWFTDGRSHLFNLAPQSSQEPLEERSISEWEMKISQLYLQGAKTLDERQRQAIYHETQRLVAEYVPFVYLVNPFSLTAIRNRVNGVKYSALGAPFWNIHELMLEN